MIVFFVVNAFLGLCLMGAMLVLDDGQPTKTGAPLFLGGAVLFVFCLLAAFVWREGWRW
ncbi:MAG: hypothetical protein KGL39_54100 [Patescibacteria group bacterium]|nr:hypothetical protein [Patescibacteria group bacterium]